MKNTWEKLYLLIAGLVLAVSVMLMIGLIGIGLFWLAERVL